MRIASVLLALVMTWYGSAALSAQAPHTSGTLMQVILDELPPDRTSMIGVVRTTYEAGAASKVVTGSGPSLHFVEAGILTLTSGDGAPPLVVHTVTAGEASMPQEDASGSIVVEEGDAFLLPPGTTAGLRNDDASPATILELLAAPDAAAEVGEGAAQSVLVRREEVLPAMPVVVTLTRLTIEPGERVPLPDTPVLSTYVAVERNQSFLISGQGVNRSTESVDAYVLAIEANDQKMPG